MAFIKKRYAHLVSPKWERTKPFHPFFGSSFSLSHSIRHPPHLHPPPSQFNQNCYSVIISTLFQNDYAFEIKVSFRLEDGLVVKNKEEDSRGCHLFLKKKYFVFVFRLILLLDIVKTKYGRQIYDRKNSDPSPSPIVVTFSEGFVDDVQCPKQRERER